jgi:hypothetical protein
MFVRKILFTAALCGALGSCLFNVPEQVTVKASPAMYLPVGSPDVLKKQLAGLSGGLGKLADLPINSSDPNTVIYDYRGEEYGDTRVVMAVMRDLANEDFSSSADALDALVNSGGPGSFPYPVSGLAIPPGTSGKIDLGGLFGAGGVLKDYPGLKFRSVPAYLYITGPATVLANSTVTLKFQNGGGTALPGSGYNGKVYPLALPGFPAAPGPVTAALARSNMVLELKEIFNNPNPPADLKAQLDFAVGTISIGNSEELRAFAGELRTPLTAHLVLLLPFQFTASAPIPVFAGPDLGATPPPAGYPPNPAMKISDSGDLLGRDGAGNGTMDKVVNNLQAFIMEVAIVNNLGINGYIKMLPGVPGTYDPTIEGLGENIGLSGTSSISIAKDKLGYPFSPALEIYLDGDFDIKRSSPPGEAMAVNLGIILRTSVEKTF